MASANMLFLLLFPTYKPFNIHLMRIVTANSKKTVM